MRNLLTHKCIYLINSPSLQHTSSCYHHSIQCECHLTQPFFLLLLFAVTIGFQRGCYTKTRRTIPVPSLLQAFKQTIPQVCASSLYDFQSRVPKAFPNLPTTYHYSYSYLPTAPSCKSEMCLCWLISDIWFQNYKAIWYKRKVKVTLLWAVNSSNVSKKLLNKWSISKNKEWESVS